MCRRELDKAESEIKKNSSIIGDYKQVSTNSWWCGLLSKYRTSRYFRRFLEINVTYAMHLRKQFSHSKWEACGWFCIFFGWDPKVVSPVCPWCGYLWVSSHHSLSYSQTLFKWAPGYQSFTSCKKKLLSHLPLVKQMHLRNNFKKCLFPFKALLWHSSSWSQGANSCVSLVGPYQVSGNELALFTTLSCLVFSPKGNKRAVLFLTFSGSFRKAELLITYVATAPFPVGIEEYVGNGKMYSATA